MNMKEKERTEKMARFWRRIGFVLLLVYSATLVFLFIGIGLYGSATVSEPRRWWWAFELTLFVGSTLLAAWLLWKEG